ncbi:MAG: hypothetical protein JXR07_14105 [Reichenbachiella sp.]
MKNNIGVALIVFSAFFLTFCGEEDEETCSADDFCSETVTVTVCCTDGSCVYQYDGEEYPDTDQGLDDLTDALACTTAKSELIPSLRTLAAGVRNGL